MAFPIGYTEGRIFLWSCLCVLVSLQRMLASLSVSHHLFFLTPKILRPWLWVLRAWYPGLPATVATMWAREILTTCSLLPYVVAGIRWKGH